VKTTLRRGESRKNSGVKEIAARVGKHRGEKETYGACFPHLRARAGTKKHIIRGGQKSGKLWVSAAYGKELIRIKQVDGKWQAEQDGEQHKKKKGSGSLSSHHTRLQRIPTIISGE